MFGQIVNKETRRHAETGIYFLYLSPIRKGKRKRVTRIKRKQEKTKDNTATVNGYRELHDHNTRNKSQLQSYQNKKESE